MNYYETEADQWLAYAKELLESDISAEDLAERLSNTYNAGLAQMDQSLSDSILLDSPF